VPPPDPEQQKRIDQLIVQLDADSFAEREKASAELKAIGDPATPALRKVLQGAPTAEVRLRAERLLGGGGAPPPDRLRTLRALEVLERLDTPDAHRLIDQLAKGAPGAWLTQEAQQMQQRRSRRAP
jgi:hypothetical protein